MMFDQSRARLHKVFFFKYVNKSFFFAFSKSNDDELESQHLPIYKFEFPAYFVKKRESEASAIFSFSHHNVARVPEKRTDENYENKQVNLCKF